MPKSQIFTGFFGYKKGLKRVFLHVTFNFNEGLTQIHYLVN